MLARAMPAPRCRPRAVSQEWARGVTGWGGRNCSCSLPTIAGSRETVFICRKAGYCGTLRGGRFLCRLGRHRISASDRSLAGKCQSGTLEESTVVVFEMFRDLGKGSLGSPEETQEFYRCSRPRCSGERPAPL